MVIFTSNCTILKEFQREFSKLDYVKVRWVPKSQGKMKVLAVLVPHFEEYGSPRLPQSYFPRFWLPMVNYRLNIMCKVPDINNSCFKWYALLSSAMKSHEILLHAAWVTWSLPSSSISMPYTHFPPTGHVAAAISVIRPAALVSQDFCSSSPHFT